MTGQDDECDKELDGCCEECDLVGVVREFGHNRHAMAREILELRSGGLYRLAAAIEAKAEEVLQQGRMSGLHDARVAGLRLAARFIRTGEWE